MLYIAERILYIAVRALILHVAENLIMMMMMMMVMMMMMMMMKMMMMMMID